MVDTVDGGVGPEKVGEKRPNSGRGLERTVLRVTKVVCVSVGREQGSTSREDGGEVSRSGPKWKSG